MPRYVTQKVLEKARQDRLLPAPCSRRTRVMFALRALWCIRRSWWPTSSHGPPEMHAIDYLAKDHPRAFV
jgi:hypothetical protein